MHPAIEARLPAFIAEHSGARAVRIDQVSRLGGGAIQDNFALDVDIEGGDMHGRHALVLRTDAASTVAVSHSRAEEFALLQVAHAAGITVPQPLWCESGRDTGPDFFLMHRVAGTADGNRLAKTLGGTDAGQRLAARLGAELARLHRLRPPWPGLEFLPVPDGNPALERVRLYRGYLDALGAPELAIEYALSWLQRNAPDDWRVALCHCDLRSGNYLADEGELTAVLDWEFAAWSDPMEDIGWFCARSWRFGNWRLEAGGLAARKHFIGGYEAESGSALPRERLLYWEVMAAVRWAVIALQQAERHLSGAQTSLALALTGRMAAEMEYDMLALIERAEQERAGA
jgi:aminoglycoside phosphotransferase (APT) family kinase protein